STFLNTTFFAAICGLTYLCVDPVVKAVYVLRCFYGESRQTGQDLKAELRVFATPARTAAMLCLLGALLLGAGARLKAAEPLPASATSVKPDELNHTIEQVLQRPEFTWRLPRQKTLEQQKESKIS